MKCILQNKLTHLIGPLKDARSFILVTCIACTGYFLFGYYITQVPHMIRQLGKGDGYIAYIASMSAAATILAGMLLGYLPILLKTRQLYIALISILTVLLVGYGVLEVDALFLVLSFFVFTLFITLTTQLTRSYVNFLADEFHVARIEAFSHMLHTITFGLGPIVAGLNFLPMAQMSLIFATLLLVLLFAAWRYGALVDIREAHRSEVMANLNAKQPKKQPSLPKLMVAAPVALIVAIMYGVVDQISDFMGPAFGKVEHFSLLEQDSLVSIYTWGGGLLIIFIAILVDKLPKSIILIGYIALCLIVAGLLYFFGHTFELTAFAFALMGAMTGSFGPYISALYRKKLKGSNFVRALSSANILYGIGALMGPNLYTLIAHKEKINTLFIMILFVAVILFVALLWRKAEERAA